MVEMVVTVTNVVTRHRAEEILEKKVSIHFWAPNLISRGQSVYLIEEVSLKFGGWLGLDINFGG